jgi:two-component system sensor kinase FixL
MRYKLELQQARHSLDQYSKADLLGECSVMLAHELNQPLTAILSNAQAAQRYIESDALDIEEVRAILKDIVDDDRRASEIIKRIRMLLKSEDAAREFFDLNATIEEVVEMLGSELVDNNIALSTNFSEGLAPVYAGRVEVQLVLMNLMLNALKVMADSGGNDKSISIVTHMHDDEALVEIADTGPGIAKELHDSLFDRFVTGKSNSLGMGLAISRRIIERFGGRIWADNKGDGGAVFSFTLPLENTKDVKYG